MESARLPEDCSKQWEVILLLLSSEEKRIDKTTDNELDMMAYFYYNEGVRKILHQWLWQMRHTSEQLKSQDDTSTKCNHVALLWRQRGNEKFRTNNMVESHRCYTKSVLYAKHNEQMFALAVANRSATLLRLKRYKDCLMDVSLALNSGYPMEQAYKLYLRKADSHIELHEVPQAKASLALALEYAHKLEVNSNSRKDLERNIVLLEKKMELRGATKTEDFTDVTPECFLGPNEQFASASTALELRKSDTCGRYVVTNTEVQRGNILFVEEPYAFVALPLNSLLPIVCENCCESNINPVPCWVCSRSVYCSEQCRAAAWDTFHKWECVGAQSQVWPTIGIAHLALRVLLISTKNGFPSTNIDISKPVNAAKVFSGWEKVDNMEVYKKSSDRFLSVFHLVTNFDKMNNTDYIQYALTAVMLTIYLEEHTTYFDSLPASLPFKMTEPEARLLVASLLLRHMGQLVCNGHAIMALNEQPDGRRTSVEREVRLATAIYPSASMMNHSCDPNIINSFQRSRLVVKGSRCIEAGAEVYNCYGPAFTREPAHHRRAQLKAQYLFNCACPACSDPYKKDFILQFTAYSCHLCKGPVIINYNKTYCNQCNSTDLTLERTLAVLNQSEDLIKQAELCSNLSQRCEKLQASLKLKQKVLHRHHIAVRDNMDRLACHYAELGQWSKTVDLIKQCIPSLEYQFGSFSVEVAHELRKLADVMLERVLSDPQHPSQREWCLETHKIIKKALQLTELNYGPWDQSYGQLRLKEATISSLLPQHNYSSTSDHSIHDLLHYNLKI